MGDETYNPLDISSQEDAARDESLRRQSAYETELADVKWLMERKQGRRFIWRLLDAAGVFRTSFHATAMIMAFNEGQRNYGIRLFSQVQTACPELYTVMLKEAQNGK